MAQTKAKALRELSDAELVQKIREAETELANLKFQTAVTPPKNPHRLPLLRKEVARCRTIQRERMKKESK